MLPPKAISRTAPVYPYELRRSGNRGEVLIQFVVDVHGNVVSPTVLKSTHPAFEAPAVAAVLKWKFVPGSVNGKPVNTRMAVPIYFQIDPREPFNFQEPPGPDSEGGAEAFSVGSGKSLPPEYRYDEPPKPSLTVNPVYPLGLLRDGKEGRATVGFVVSEKGTVVFAEVMKTSDPEFGKAAAAAVLCWRFEPATRAGAPVPTVLRHEFRFEEGDRDLRLDDEAAGFLDLLKRHPEKLRPLGKLDALPRLKYRVVPVLAPKSDAHGRVLIEFYIDQTGQVRFPHALKSSDDRLTYPALTAVSRWQFTPPLAGGRPVAAVAQIPIVFSQK